MENLDAYVSFYEPDVEYSQTGKPIYKRLKLTPLEKSLAVCSFFVLSGFWISSILSLSSLPDTILLKLSGIGLEDRNISKYSILFIPTATTLFAFILHLLCLAPHKYNLSNIPITLENASRIYKANRTIIRFISTIISATVFGMFALWVHAINYGRDLNTLMVLFLLLGAVLALIVGMMGFFNYVNKNKGSFGFRST